MTTQDKNQLWTLCLESACKKMSTIDGRIGNRLEEAKTEAGKNFRAMLTEIGDARPDFNGICETLALKG